MKIFVVFNGPFDQAPLTAQLRWWVKKEKGRVDDHQLECSNTAHSGFVRMTITLMVTEKEQESLLERVDILGFARKFFRFGKVTVTEFKEFQGSMRTITLVLE